jgi:branched-subunit amino acid ABC-type transport system permease component
MAGTEPHAWGTGRMDDITYVGLDVHKATVCVAVAESGRGGEVLGGISLVVKGELNIQLGTDLLLPVFASSILGGLGNPMGAVVGAIVIATAETLVTNVDFGVLLARDFAFLPAGYATAASFAILVRALLLRPQGLFTK